MRRYLQGRTPSRLLEAMGEELEKIFKDVKVEVEEQDGRRVTKPVHTFIQGIPVTRAGEDEEEQYPQVEFRIIQGYNGYEGDEDNKRIYVGMFVYGVCDHRRSADCWKQLLHMYEIVENRFMYDPILEGFEAVNEHKFEMQSDDTYPFYFMASTIKFAGPLKDRQDVNDLI